jgi:hypothetical protein
VWGVALDLEHVEHYDRDHGAGGGDSADDRRRDDGLDDFDHLDDQPPDDGARLGPDLTAATVRRADTGHVHDPPRRGPVAANGLRAGRDRG